LAARLLLALLMLGAWCWPQTTTSKTTTRKSSAHRRSHRRTRGQQHIDPKRVREIQAALIREHYLSGKPSGRWDAATQRALVRLQGDNGWQTKVVPDSRALIKLGLGPDHDHLLNPESAMTAPPAKDPQPASKATPVEAEGKKP
jgi:hypothetical protein